MHILTKPWKTKSKKIQSCKFDIHQQRRLKAMKKKENEIFRSMVNEIIQKKRRYIEKMQEIERKKTEERILAFKRRKR
ncbi:hypothetical protein THOM_0870 [Trachipleistophora hominis]|uniref:Uncharacterized protein n=1 Tax=Trachipleistophora hominis TaxID=72359 RepID=L7JXL6_TRAHO|nr:hypothetical protein THOM_0870 [Trachipleistophora hominis]